MLTLLIASALSNTEAPQRTVTKAESCTYPRCFPIEVHYDRSMDERLGIQATIDMWFQVQFKKCVPFIDRAKTAAEARDSLSYPAPGSPLATDDQILKPLYDATKIDSLAMTSKWAALMAEDQLISAWPARPREENGYREVKFSPYAGFTLLRGSMEASAYALWLLAPNDTETRLKRFARLTIENQEKYLDVITAWHLSRGTDGAGTAVASNAKVEALFASAGVDPARYQGPKSLIEKAGKYVPSGELPWKPIVAWQVASGVAHGMPWSRHEAAKTFHDQSTGRATVKMDAESYRYVLQAATVMFETLVKRIEELQAVPPATPDPRG